METIIKSIKNILNLYTKKILSSFSKLSAISKFAKMTSFAIVLSIVPMGNAGMSLPIQNESKILFNQSNLIFAPVDNNKVQIEVGKSNFDIEQEKNAKQVKAVSSFVEVAHNDPVDFKPIYFEAAKQFGIPWQLIEAVHEVESGKSGSTSKKSFAGATGPMQFMPGTWRGYGVDGNGDGVADISDVTDAIYTGANYLAKSGADEGRIDDALYNYNHSLSYVNKVKTIAYEIGLPK